MKAAIIYWSSTGNTEAMANAIAEGAGSVAEVKQVSEISADEAANYDVLALGCPAQGSEELDETEFEPFFSELLSKLSGKKVALFGSYGWGDGEWMRSWEGRVKEAGAELVNGQGLTANNTPDDDAIAACKTLGEQIAAL